MEGGGRKKRLPFHEEEEKDMNDEEKIEKFFAIIRRFRDARDRPANSLHDSKEAIRATKKTKVHEPAAVWVPSFQWEDFAEPNANIANSNFSTRNDSIFFLVVNPSLIANQKDETVKNSKGALHQLTPGNI
ncbi:hypothetical protein F0562_020067 [Nyssa sinensis]|uniref:Uncharacterized protein n=1 Tax=Nyssa sinensis TaxID=561372 RepID=A0A5J5BQ45_9ASTE|nr:hypothetical protein F0562_020067 [Nyssa sinensis]